MRAIITTLLLLIFVACNSVNEQPVAKMSLAAPIYQKGGLNYPVMSKDSAVKLRYTLVETSDSLIKYANIPGSKIFISKSFEVMQRCSVATNVTIQSDKKSTINSRLWYNKYRFYETFTIIGKNVIMQGLNLRGDNPDILTLDYAYNQTAIRCAADSFRVVNCNFYNWGWCGVYFYRYGGAWMEQCYCRSTKTSGYGYAVWFEGTIGQVGVVKDCIWEGNREDVDAGGQLNKYTVDGCVIDRGVTSHVNLQKQGGIGMTATNNYCVGRKSIGFCYPAVDSGFVVIKNNYFIGAPIPFLEGEFRDCMIDTVPNFYNGEGMSQPMCDVSVDSIYSNNNVGFTFLTTEKKVEVYWGDGTEPSFIAPGKTLHKYLTNGTYLIGARSWDYRGVPSNMVYKKFVVGTGLNFAFKTTARFTPGAGVMYVQLLVDDTLQLLNVDASKWWQWRRITRDMELKGTHKIAIRFYCAKDCSQAIQLWVDDFDFNGLISNSNFEERLVWNTKTPVSYWKYQGHSENGNTLGAGAGTDPDEKCGGEYSWHFEFRPTSTNILRHGTYIELYTTFNFK